MKPRSEIIPSRAPSPFSPSLQSLQSFRPFFFLAGPGISSPAMAFPGGSAYAMARDVAEGYLLVTERTFKNLTRADLDQLAFEIDRHLRELRGDQPALDDLPAIQLRQRKMQRLNSALMMLRGYRQRQKI